MLKPSFQDLIDAVNETAENKITSRYTIVIATSKRARQLIDKNEPLTMSYPIDKPVSIAIQEIYESLITLKI